MGIHFVNELPPQGEGVYLHYYQRKIEHSSIVSFQFKQELKERQASWYLDLETWHTKMCKSLSKEVALWDLLLGSRLVTWYPPIFQPFILVCTAIELEPKYKNVYLIDFPSESEEYLKEQKSGSYKKLPLSLKRFARPLLNTFTRSISNLFKSNIKTHKNYKKMIYSTAQKVDFYKVTGDHFFGNTFANELDENIWVLDTNLNSSDKADYIKQIEKEKKHYIFIKDQLSILGCLKVFKLVIKTTIQLIKHQTNMPAVKIGKFESRLLTDQYFINSLLHPNFIYNIETKLSFHNILREISVEKIIYPFEDKGLEKAILKANNNAKTIGFAHAVSNTGLTYFKDKSDQDITFPRPDIIASTGSLAKDWLVNYAQNDDKKVINIGTKRYFNEQKKDKSSFANLNILILISAPFEMLMLANFFEENPEVFDRHSIRIRKYPFAFAGEQQQGADRILKACPHVKVEIGDIKEQFNWSDLLLFTSTSAGIEGTLYGRISAYIDMNHLFELNPFANKGNSNAFKKCYTSSDLKDLFEEISGYNIDQYRHKVTEQREYAIKLYDRPSVSELNNV